MGLARGLGTPSLDPAATGSVRRARQGAGAPEASEWGDKDSDPWSYEGPCNSIHSGIADEENIFADAWSLVQVADPYS